MTDIARERRFLRDQGLDIILRENWTSQSYASDRTVSEPVEGFFLHISVTIDGGNTGLSEEDDMRDIERIGNERFNGIGFPYNAAIFDTGRLYEGQPLTRRGAHTVNDEGQPGFRETGSHGSLNYWYRAIVLPQMVTDDVTDAQVDQCARWAAAQIRAGYAKRDATWHGHRDVSAKSCPGDAGYARLPEIRRLTAHYVTNGLQEDDDMPYTPEQMLDLIEQGVENALAVRNGKPGKAVDQMEARVAHGVEDSLAKRYGHPDGLAVDQMHARVRDGVKLALDDPDVQKKLRAVLGVPEPAPEG